MTPDEPNTWLGPITMAAGAAALVAVALAGRLKPAALRDAPHRMAGLDHLDLLMGVCVFLCGGIVAAALLTQLGLQPGEDADPLSAQQYAVKGLLSQALVHGVVLLFVIARVMRTTRGLSEFGLVPRSVRREAWAAVLGLLAGLAMTMGLITVVSAVGEAFGCKAPEIGHKMLEVMRDSDSVWASAALIFSAVAVAPVVEEIIFRGLVQSVLLELFGRGRRWLVVFCAAALFASVHVDPASWQTLPGLFVLGMVLGWLYERHGSLLPCVLVHAGFNMCNVALMYAGA